MKHVRKLLDGYVSIMIPCYNGAAYVGRLLDSICKQTYLKIHLIFVNDGSDDETEQIFYSYEEIFKEKGFLCDYIYQNNKGQAAAINEGLRYLLGEFCMWLDADDFISQDHIERKVVYLKQNKECSIVMCQGIVVDETDIETIRGYLAKDSVWGTLFEDLLLELKPCTGGLFMVRTCSLLEALKDNGIYTSRVGQNLQLLLPVSYLYNVGYLGEVLFYYVNREDSHSHNIHGLKNWHKRLDGIKDIKIYILHEMAHLFSVEYAQFLNVQLALLQLSQKLDIILENVYDIEEEVFIKEVIIELAARIKSVRGNKANCWMWGACEKNIKLANYLKQYSNIQIIGFVDTNPEKQSKAERIISPNDIDASTMYIIIPLQYYQDIVRCLHFKGLKKNQDFIYPKYELIENLKNQRKHNFKNEKNRDFDISLCG